MIDPFNRGAQTRAAIAAAFLSLIAFFAFAPHAHAEGRRHAAAHHHHHIHWAKHHRAHHRELATIDVRTGSVEMVPAQCDPFEMLGSLFQPPVAAAQSQINRGIAVAGQVPARVAAATARSVSSGYAIVARLAPEFGVPVSVAVSEVAQESSGNCHAHSRTDARGVLQVEPYTAVKDGFDPHRLYECEYGAIAGLTELKHLIEADGGITCHALSRYYGSDTYLRRFRGGCAPYGRQVLARARAIEAQPLAPEIWEARWIGSRHRHHRHHWRV